MPAIFLSFQLSILCDSHNLQLARSHILLAPAIYASSQPHWKTVKFNHGSIPVYLNKPLASFQTTNLEDMDSFYIQFWSNNDSASMSIKTFCIAALEKFKRSKKQYLIMDHRFNSGGNIHKTEACIQEFATSIPSNGHIFLVVGNATFSAGIYSAAFIAQYGANKVSIVGDDVGDSLIAWAEDNLLILPNSGIQIKYSTGKHDISNGCNDWQTCYWGTMYHDLRVKSLAPNLRAPPTFNDYINNIGPSMPAIRSHISSNFSGDK